MRQYGLETFDFSEISAGTENTSYHINTGHGHYILRIYRKYKKTTTQIYNELDYMYYLLENGIPVPRVSRTTDRKLVGEIDIDGYLWQTVLLEYQSGAHPMRYDHELTVTLAQTQAHMHLLGIKLAEKEPSLTIASRQLTVLEMLRSRLPIFGRWGLPMGLVHLDLTTENILLDNFKITAVIDFDDMAYAPVADCLASTLCHIAFAENNKATLEKYIAAYRAIRPLSILEIIRIRLLVAYKLQRRLHFAESSVS